VLPEASDILKQADAVRDDRRLLDTPDPVPDILKAAADILRQAVNMAYTEFRSVYEREMKSLTGSAVWGKLNSGQQADIISGAGITDISAPALGDDAALLRSLDDTSLTAWKTLTDALTQRFGNAALEVAKLLEPKVRRVAIKGATLRTPEDVKAWAAATEKDLLEKIKDGPIMIS
jgi:hypothetical protein